MHIWILGMIVAGIFQGYYAYPDSASCEVIRAKNPVIGGNTVECREYSPVK